MANKKICIFSAQHLPHMGGVERYTYNLCKKLIEKGNEPVVVTSKIGDLPNFEIMHDTRIYRFNCYPFLKGRYPFLKKDSEYNNIISILEKRFFYDKKIYFSGIVNFISCFCFCRRGIALVDKYDSNRSGHFGN